MFMIVGAATYLIFKKALKMAVCVVESQVTTSLGFKFADELVWQKERTLTDTLTNVIENFTERWRKRAAGRT